MSAARILAANLYALGRRAKRIDFDDWSIPADASRHAMQELRGRGLIRNAGAIGVHAVWELTPAGREWVEGRLALCCGRHPMERQRNTAAPRRQRFGKQPRAARLIRTFLGSLPQGIRIEGAAA